jgi:hypothetical protein
MRRGGEQDTRLFAVLSRSAFSLKIEVRQLKLGFVIP